MWIHAAHAEKGCIALSAPLVITNLAAFFLFSFTEFTCSTSGNSHDVRESSGLLTNNLKLWIEFKKQKKTKEKTTSKGYFIMWQRGCFFLRHGGHVEAVAVDVRYGPLWPETHRQPLRETRRKSYRRRCRKKCDVFQFTVSLFVCWPVWEIRESTPACRPCRLGSTWRTRSRWCIPLWCSSRGTYSRTVWGVALSGRSWLWYTENSGETLGVPYLKHFHIC